MRRRLKIMLAAASLAAAQAGAAAPCFELLDPAGELVQRTGSAPIDLSMTISQGLAARGLAGYHLTWFEDRECREMGATPSTAAARPAPRSTGGGTYTRLEPGPYRAMADAQEAARSRQADVDRVLEAVADRHGASTAMGVAHYIGPGRYVYDGGRIHTGPRGGKYTVTPSGRKRYESQNRRR